MGKVWVRQGGVLGTVAAALLLGIAPGAQAQYQAPLAGSAHVSTRTANSLGGAAAALPTLTEDQLPRPSTPPPERGTVVPAQVERWREDAKRWEHGDGLSQDPVMAAKLYCRAARYGDAEAQYNLGWMLTNARGIQRNDSEAAHLFAAAAEQGMQQAQNMLNAMGGTPMGDPPPCLRPPETDPPLAVAEKRPPVVAGAGLKLAQASLLPPPPPPANAPAALVKFVQLVAPDYGLQPHLVLAVMAAESNFDVRAVSPKNAQGLMQVMPATGARFGVTKLSDPAQNIRAGMAYLRWLLAYFEGDITLALAGYNAGEGAVDRYLGVPPYAETRLYVRKIVANINGQRFHPFDPKYAEASPLVGRIKMVASAMR
ncbi:transglycosylase SLT domain-containing protein [Roseateles paludis]|uniref:Transglycosylase SLT domain-containing protein n=1 Tax=Roseateles paludis TaxID=3145238 RepID=A0ABV0G7E7_9BURK